MVGGADLAVEVSDHSRSTCTSGEDAEPSESKKKKKKKKNKKK